LYYNCSLMTEAVPTGFGVEPSASVREVLNRHGLGIDSDRLALDAMAESFGRTTPEKPRVVLLHEGEIAHHDDMTVLVAREDDIIGMRKLHAPTVHEGDYVVRLPRGGVPESEMVSAGLARIFQRGQRWRQEIAMKWTGAGLIVGGLIESGIAYVVMRNDQWDNLGYAVMGAGIGLITYASSRDKDGKPPDISQLEHPVRIVPKARYHDGLPGSPGEIIPGSVVDELPPSDRD
jgi:hypothetical protein